MKAPFKAVSMQQIEEAFACALATLTGREATVTIRTVKEVSDGADRLIWQERWRMGIVVTVVHSD